MSKSKTIDEDENLRQLELPKLRRPFQSITAKLLLFSLLLLLFSIHNYEFIETIEAASNINPVWLSNDDDHHNQDNLIFPSSANSMQSPQTDIHRTSTSGPSEDAWHPAIKSSQQTMRTSPSSLQPSIVSMDTDNGEHVRRSDSSGDLLYMNHQHSSNQSRPTGFSNEASSLDHHWNGQIGPLNQTNSQVQFDETLSPLSKRLELNETSTLSPQFIDHRNSDSPAHQPLFSQPISDHEPPYRRPQFSSDEDLPTAFNLNKTSQLNRNQQTNEYFSDLQQPTLPPPLHESNYNLITDNRQKTFDYEQSQRQYSQPSRNNRTSSITSSSFIYYMPESNHRNFSTISYQDTNERPDKAPVSSRRKLHNSGTQYDLNEVIQSDQFPSNRPRQPLAGQINPNYFNSNQGEPFKPVEYYLNSQHQAVTTSTTPTPWLPSNQLNNYAFVPISEPNFSPQKISDFVASKEFHRNGYIQPTAAYNSAANDNFRFLSQPNFVAPRIVQHPSQYHWQQQQQLKKRKPSLNHRRTNENLFVGTVNGNKRKSSSNRNKILKYIKPTPKPKKSLFNVLKLNSWIDGIGNSNSGESIASGDLSTSYRVVTPKQLEATFYENSINHPFKTAPSSNNYAFQMPGSDFQPSGPQPVFQQQDVANTIMRPVVSYYPTQPPLAPPVPIRQGYPLTVVQQPTVAPVSRYYQQQLRRRKIPTMQPHQYYSNHLPTSDRHLNQGSQHLSDHYQATGKSSQQNGAAAFIPVVAVSVTKTSPAPTVESLNEYTDQNLQTYNNESEETPSAIDNYLDMKLNNGAGNQRGSYKQQYNNRNLEDFGNYASGSSSKGVTRQQTNQLLKNHHHPEQTTTIKSAVFGYLPHQAEQPFLEAMNLLPNIPVQRSNGDGALNNYYSQESTFNEPQIAAVEEPPSLSLQLQANSLVQNELANSFYGTQDYKQQLAQQKHYKPFDIYPTSQAQYHGFQLIQPAIDNEHAPSQNYNPLLFHNQAPGSHMLNTAASDLDPLLPFMFASPANSQNSGPSNQEANGQNYNSATDSSTNDNQVDDNQSDSNSEGTEPAGSSINKLSDQHQALKGNKKRSSDFFASAGQLLLSALPLLLAPTLGLMFASSPNPMARFHGPNPFSHGGQQGNSGQLSGNGANGFLSEGIVMNASPVPQLFTPTPPEYSYFNVTTTPSSTTTTTRPAVAQMSQQKKSSATLISKTNKTKTTPVPYKTTIILTTMEPSSTIFGSSLNESSLAKSNSFWTENYKRPNSTNTNQLLVAKSQPTTQIMVLDTKTPQNLDNSSFINESMYSLASSNKSKQQNADIISGGYDGADFDAQFPTLKKNNHKSSNSSISLNKNKYHLVEPIVNKTILLTNEDLMRKNHYQYSEVPTTTMSPDFQEESVTTEKLYPVPTRKKTVSLVTSNGNKTFQDSSDKYLMNNSHVVYDQFDEDYSAPQVVTNNRMNNHSVTTIRSQHDHVALKPIRLSFKEALDEAEETKEESRSHSTRRKRSIDLQNVTSGATNDSTSGRQLVKVIKKIVRLSEDDLIDSNNLLALDSSSRPELLRATFHNRNSSSRTNNSGDFMRGDATKSKAAHIITTMITHSTDSADSDYPTTPEGQNSYATKSDYIGDDNNLIYNSIRDNDYYSSPANSNDINQQISETSDDIRDQKLILDKIGASQTNGTMIAGNSRMLMNAQHNPRSRIYSSSQPEEIVVNEDLNPELNRTGFMNEVGYNGGNSFSAGGRGRFPPSPTPPIEVTSTKIRLFSNDSVARPNNNQRSRYNQIPLSGGIRASAKESKLVLTEDTKKALANFGHLLIKDTLQVTNNDNEIDQVGRRRQVNGRPVSSKSRRDYGDRRPPMINYSARQNHRPSSEGNYDFQPVSSATERSLIFKTTPLPLPMPAGMANDYQHLDYNTPNPMFYQANANGRHHYQTDYHNTTPVDNYSNLRIPPPPMRDRVNLIDNGNELLPGQNSFNQNDDRSASNQPDYYYNGHSSGGPNKLSYPPDNRLTGSNSFNRTSSSENMESNDLRHPIYSNSNSSEMRRNEYSDYLSNSQYYPPPPRPGDRPGRDPLSAQSYPNYDPLPPPRSYQPNHYNQYPSSNEPAYGGNNYSQTYNYKPSASQYNHHQQQPSYDHYSSQVAPGSYHKAAEQAGYGPSFIYQQRQQYGDYNRHSIQANDYYSPAPRYSRYSPAESPSSASASALLHQSGGPLAAITSANDRSQDTKAVNEYLKRVQFSDSDRDKLMAR